MTKIKQMLKRIHAARLLNYFLKSKLQERKAERELDYYEKEAIKRKIKLPGERALKKKLKERLAARGIIPERRKKGNLHIFLTYPLASWEAALPRVLKNFGKVTEFEFHSRGFDEKAKDWLAKRELLNKEMLSESFKANEEQKIDVVIGYLSGHNTNPVTLKKIADAGAIIFNFCWDDKLLYRNVLYGKRWRGVAAIAGAVDLNLSNSPSSLIKYFVDGGLALFWPEAADPETYNPKKLGFKYNVSFIGQKYGYREILIKKLKEKGIDVATFGAGWKNGSVSNEDIVRIYSQSRINLGFAGVGMSKKLMCLKARDFEVPMSRALYLTQDNPELPLVYNVGKEIVTYKNLDDCAEKICWLLANPGAAEKIRKAGYNRALKEHSWEKRFDDLFKLAGLLR